MGQLGQQVIIEAGNELGVVEATGHNDGPAVKSFLNSVGLPEGYAWCMAFIYWCVNKAGASIGLQNPLKQTGGVLDEFESRPDLHIPIPEQGCIGIMNEGEGKGHAFIITGVFLGEGIVHTIEGNSNNSGSREGIGVFRHERQINTIYGFLRLPDIPV